MAEVIARSAYDVQRDFALSSGFRNEIIWDSLAPDQGFVLEQKLEELILDTGGNARALDKRRKQIFQNVWKQRIYTNRTLLSAIIYVLVTDARDPALALKSTTFSCHPVIRTRKCVRTDGINSEGCCMLFIDEEGRVYGSWEKYMYNNGLPKGTMIAPKKGVYTFDDDEHHEVQLVVQATPATGLKRKFLNVSDKLVTIGGVVASVPLVATAAVPVVGTFLTAATALGTYSVAYSTLRSATRLIDRRRHGQTTSLADSDARGSWLGVAGGVAGLGVTGASTAVNLLRGKTGTMSQLAVNGINISSLVISGSGVANGVYDLYVKISDDQPLDPLTVMQLASSLLLFTHTVNNMRLASKVTDGFSLRRALHNQSRKVFDRIAQESAKLHDNIRGKLDIVRIVNDIPFKDALLNLATIGGQVSAGSGLLNAVSGANVLPKFMGIGDNGQPRLDLKMLASQLGNKFVQQIGHLGSFTDVLVGLTRTFDEQSSDVLLGLTRNFVDRYVDTIGCSLNTFISTELVLYRVLKHCLCNYENTAADFLEGRKLEILNKVNQYFQALHPQPENNHRRKCATCHGVYYMCSL